MSSVSSTNTSPSMLLNHSGRGRLWQRESEEHIEYAHEPQMLKKLLNEHGFIDIKVCTDCPQGDDGRIFIVAKNTEH